MRPGRKPDRLRELASPATRRASGTSAAPATRASRASPPTSASTRARRSTSRSTPTSTDYRLDIYRLGYYGGARRPQGRHRPARRRRCRRPAGCLNDATTGLVDCGNWAVSASWAVPADAVSGIYFAKLVREDGTGGASHIVFVVRDDDGTSDLLFQTSDTTWQAYNQYGGNSLYTGGAGRAAPTRSATTGRSPPAGTTPEDWRLQRRVPDGPLARAQRLRRQLLHRRRQPTGAAREILEHKVFLSVGHDEYWSGDAARQRRGGARRRRQPRLLQRQRGLLEDPLGEQHRRLRHRHRTLVCYKETHANAKIDPAA